MPDATVIPFYRNVVPRSLIRRDIPDRRFSRRAMIVQGIVHEHIASAIRHRHVEQVEQYWSLTLNLPLEPNGSDRGVNVDEQTNGRSPRGTAVF